MTRTTQPAAGIICKQASAEYCCQTSVPSHKLIVFTDHGLFRASGMLNARVIFSPHFNTHGQVSLFSNTNQLKFLPWRRWSFCLVLRILLILPQQNTDMLRNLGKWTERPNCQTLCNLHNFHISRHKRWLIWNQSKIEFNSLVMEKWHSKLQYDIAKDKKKIR